VALERLSFQIVHLDFVNVCGHPDTVPDDFREILVQFLHELLGDFHFSLARHEGFYFQFLFVFLHDILSPGIAPRQGWGGLSYVISGLVHPVDDPAD
jgi:hypothetical protein